MDVRLPDGTIIKDVPDGTTKADLVAKLQGNGMAVPSEWLSQEAKAPERSAVQQVGGFLRDIPRQVGLFGRYALEAGGQVAQLGSEPLRYVTDRLIGQTGNTVPAGVMASRFADTIGLPKPQNELERVVGDATRTGFSAVGMAGATGAASRGATGVGQKVLQNLAAKPGVQAVSGATAGAAGGAVREAGGDETAQFIASLLGGVAGGAGADAASRALPNFARTVAARLTPQTAQMENVDRQIRLTLERSGVDWSQVPERIRQGLRAEVAEALNTGGELSADALRRLAVMRQAGVTPTVGMLTQNPGQITREANLAKTAANSTDASLQRLPNLQNENTAALLRNLDQAGAENAPGAFQAGERAIASLRGQEASARGNINALYDAARNSDGRSMALDGAGFTQRASQLLDENLLGHALPKDVESHLNRIAQGQVPFDVNYAEQLKTVIGRLQRGTSDGSTRMALGMVRRALDDTQPRPGVLPGAMPGGDEAIAAFNSARTANREWMQRVERNPALQAVVDGIEPDQFINRFVIGNGATAADVRSLRNELDPGAVEGIRQYLVRYLRDAATNSTDDITKFSNDGYRRALRSIGDEKLAAFFEPEQLAQLRNVGEAAKLMQAQPAGSAVNNSNSGALLLGRGGDMLSNITSKLPFGLRDTLEGTIQGVQQSRALDPRNALIRLAAPDRRLPLNPLVAASVATPVQAVEDDRRR